MKKFLLLAPLMGLGFVLSAQTPRISTAPAAALAPLPAPAPVETKLAEAEAALHKGEKDEARRRLQAYLRDHKKSPEAWTLYGRVETEDKRYRRANKYFQRALKFSPQYAPAFYGKGVAEERRGRLDEAANEYRAATLADPNHLEAKAALERLKPQAGDPSGAF